MRILVADDNEVSLEMLRAVLTDAGYDVLTARDGVEALEIIRAQSIRLVVSDWEMPRMSGQELCRAVRGDEAHGYVYIILLTSHNEPAERVAGLSAGADDFVAKPFDTPELLARLRSGERVLSMETRDIAIFAMAKLAESRDPETGAHLERVRGYSRLLAHRLNQTGDFGSQIDGNFVRLIYETSPLHDIGKVGIPDNVLLKAGRLNDAEFEIMKCHTVLGAQTLGAALSMFPGVDFLEMARDIAAAHHERFDGSGYPNKLKGDEIPVAARIVAVADVYDALTSKRVYKEAWKHDIAKATIVSESGKHFDPRVVKAFLGAEESILRVHDQYKDEATNARKAA